MRRHGFNIGYYWGLKLIEQVIKVLEHAAECLIRQRVVLSSFACLFVCLYCCFTSQVNSSYSHGGKVSSPNHSFSDKISS